MPHPRRAEASQDRRGGPDRGSRDESEEPRATRRRRVNPLAEAKITSLSFKDVTLLKYFVTEKGRLISRRQTGVTAKQQRMVARAVKQARMLGLLPYDRPAG
jgi:small subunit ribosomal protein S18